MTEYYFLTQDLTKEHDAADLEGNIVVNDDVLWVEGVKFSSPVDVQTLQIDTQYGNTLPDFFDTDVPIMSEKLVRILSEKGIDNIDTYPMKLIWPDGKEEDVKYYAVNVIGCIDAIDLDASEYQEDVMVLRFRKVVIDESKTLGLKCFRLNELENLIVIEKSVAEALESASLNALSIMPVADYSDRHL